MIGPTHSIPEGPEELHRSELVVPKALANKTGDIAFRTMEYLENSPRPTTEGPESLDLYAHLSDLPTKMSPEFCKDMALLLLFKQK